MTLFLFFAQTDSLPSSEGNSADGVHPYPATLTKSASVSDSGTLAKLGNFLSFGRKKGDKIAKKLVEMEQLGENCNVPGVDKAG